MNRDLTYLEHFHLKFNPFPVAPDTENFYLSRSIDKIITEIIHGIETRKGFMIIVGEVGLGKTTMGRKIVGILREKGIESSLVLQTGFQGKELLKEINRDFKIRARSNSLADQLRRLNNFLLKKNSEGRNCAIIIDDAQNLSSESLELVRMISNLEAEQEKLVQILLIGQPELVKKLSTPQLRQLKSRIIIHEQVKPLKRDELKDYLFFKLNAAGNDGTTTITAGGLNKIYKASKGNFRIVNAIMDRCLYAGFVFDTTRITRRIVKKALMDMKGRPVEFYRRPIAWVSVGMIALGIGIGGPVIWEKLGIKHMFGIKNLIVNSHQQKVPGYILNFLSDYGLTSYSSVFFSGLTHNNLKSVAQKIFQETGFHLVELSFLPDAVKDRFGVLVNPYDKAQEKRFLVFWKPDFWVERFYYGYRGPEISKIQQKLSGLNLYTDSVDGIVGKNLMKAIVEFQKAMSLPVTGYPDDATLFLLSNMEVNSVYGTGISAQKTTG